jgi:phosphoglycerate kinase
MQIKTIRDIEVTGKRVLVRVDFNTPIENGKVGDATRIAEAIPTIRYLIQKKAKVILLSHFGRPKGKVVEEFRLTPVAEKLEELLDQKIHTASDCIGEAAEKVVSKLKEGEVALLENTRFHTEEEANDAAFAKKLSSLGDVFVAEAFGAAHRAHASTVGIAQYLPTVAGFLMEKEVKELSKIFLNPGKPMVLILGGAKIDSKIGVLRKFSEMADTILLGGGIANTFLAAQGFEIGESLYEEDKVELAMDILMEAAARGCEIVLPSDVICADAVAAISDKTAAVDIHADALPFNLKILDIGDEGRQQYAEIIQNARMVIWNGPVGLFEFKPFERGTKAIAEACAKTKATTILGGGDTLEALKRFKISPEKFTHVSTGGGAMLEFLEGKKLPGVEVIGKF